MFCTCLYDVWPKAKILHAGLSKNVFSPSSPFIHTYLLHPVSFYTPMTITPFIFLFHAPSMDVVLVIYLFICIYPFRSPSLPTVFSGAAIDSSCILRHIWTSLPSFPVSPLFQSTCDTLRSHSDSLGFAPNVLPSHPTLGNFEEFACWRRGRRGTISWSDGKLWFRLVYMYISTRTVRDE